MNDKKVVFLSPSAQEYNIGLGNFGSEEYRMNRIVDIIEKRLIDDGYNIKWYWIGEGLEIDYLNFYLKESKLENRFIFLGPKSNPYPYIRDCDIYVQPSKMEGYCTTVVEARCFNKPMVITDVGGSREQIKDNFTGFIVNCTEDDIYKKLKLLINDKNLRTKFTNNLSKEGIDTRNEVNKLYELI